MIDLDAEKATLGSLLKRPEGFDECSAILEPEDFSTKTHQEIYRVLADLHDNGKSIDPLIVSRALGDDSIGYLLQLEQETFAPEHVARYAEIVEEVSAKRRLDTLSKTAINVLANGGTAEAVQAGFEQKMQEISARRKSMDVVPIGDIVKEFLDELSAKRDNPQDDIRGIRTGWSVLDGITRGIRGGEMVILAARPGIGKTLWMLNLLNHTCVRNRVPSLFFSIEMKRQQIIANLVAIAAGVSAIRIDKATVSESEWERIVRACAIIAESPLYIYDEAGVMLPRVVALARRYVSRHNVQQIGLDYLQLVKVYTDDQKSNPFDEVTRASKGLVQMARDLDVPLFALSQLSRGPENREDKHPNMGDLRSSGQIEQDASLIMGLYRDVVYSREECEEPNVAEIDILKQRRGDGQGTRIRLDFQAETLRFVDLGMRF